MHALEILIAYRDDSGCKQRICISTPAPDIHRLDLCHTGHTIKKRFGTTFK